MPLGREDTTRIIRFCLAGSGWGAATHEEDDTCVLKLVLTGVDGTEARRFEGTTFEETLLHAIDAGVLKRTCVEKQIAFMARAQPQRGGAPDDETQVGVGVGFGVGAGVDKASSSMFTGLAIFPSITISVSALIHETQRERGISSLFTASRARLFGRELVAQWRATDRRRAELAFVRQRSSGQLPSPVTHQLARAEELLDALTASRARVETLELTSVALIDAYSSVNAALLRVIDSLASRAVDTVQRPTALAWLALLYAKEKTGIERAHLASAFERDVYADGQYQTVSGLIASRQSYLHLFSAAAPPAAEEMLREKLGSDVAVAVAEMEQVALLHHEGGFGIDPTTWFSTITRHIDLLEDVESALRASLGREGQRVS